MTSYLLFQARWQRIKTRPRGRGHFDRPVIYLVRKTGCCECVSHPGDRNGYPYQSRNGDKHRLSRTVYAAAHGPIAPGLVIRHDCDNPRCIRIDHLRIGTHADNTTDAIQRGQILRGSRCPWARLTEAQVTAIKQQTGRTAQSLADEFGVKRGAVETIRSGRNWKEVAA